MEDLTHWKLLASELALNEKFCVVRKDSVQLPDGTVVPDYFLAIRPEIAVVVAVSDTGTVPMVRQYKHGAAAVTLEFPAGTFTTEPALAAAERELAEETGWAAAAFHTIGLLYDDASKNTNNVHVVVGTGAYVASPQNLDTIERASGVDVVLVKISELRGVLTSGAVRAQSSVAAGLLALAWLEDNRYTATSFSAVRT